MKHSESIIEISKALLKAQKKIVDPKQTAENPFFKNKYAPLIDILKQLRPIYNECGITILQDVEGIKVSTIFLHETGEWIQQEWMELPVDKQTPQSAGSTITYARRYSISAWLGIASEEDDDGNQASQQNKKKDKPESSTPKEKKIDAKEQYNKFYNSLEDGYKFELKDMTDAERFKLFAKCEWNIKKLDEEIVRISKKYKEG
jgi:hypothetical protein